MIDQRLLSDPTFLGGLAVAATLLVLAMVLMLRRPRPELIMAPLAQMVARRTPPRPSQRKEYEMSGARATGTRGRGASRSKLEPLQ